MSIHIEAGKGEIADTVLLPGDPLRAKWIAENFLEDASCYNQIRGMLGYTGQYKGRRISVQGTGMGIPSAILYLHELITTYGVKNIIRVGTAGSFRKEVKIRDIIIAMAASTTSGINKYRFNGSFAPTANAELFFNATAYARKNNIKFKAGNILSADEFYEEDLSYFEKWGKYGVLCAEMETAGLYTIAAKFGVRALTLLTIADSLITKEEVSSEEREKGFSEMVKIALNCID